MSLQQTGSLTPTEQRIYEKAKALCKAWKDCLPTPEERVNIMLEQMRNGKVIR